MPHANVVLDGRSLTLDQAYSISNGAKVSLGKGVKVRLAASRRAVDKVLRGAQTVYGVNTGFGALANTRIAPEKLTELQRNFILSHAGGSGEALSSAETRLIMALRLNVLAQGLSGTRLLVCQTLQRMINAHVLPVVPAYGSVGASGDLIPLAHIGLALIGEGQVLFQGKRMQTRDALRKTRIAPLILHEKEGLSLVNGTQAMLGVGVLALGQALKLAALADAIVALSFEALGADVRVLDARVHQARGQAGQIKSARAILKNLQGSYLLKGSGHSRRVQDPYSLRCAPQVHGPSHDALSHVAEIAERELNATTDNPLVFKDDIISAGNFHGQALALTFDYACMAVAELANISERRLEVLVNPQMSGLTAFLTREPGLNSGYMVLQYLAASLVNENKVLSHPACTDSIPGNIGIEDHVSMGMTAARKFKKVVENSSTVLALELLAACQALDLRGVKKLGFGTSKLYHTLRTHVPTLSQDRIVANDVSRALEVLNKVLGS